MKSPTLVAAIIGVLVAVAGLIAYSLMAYNLINISVTIQPSQVVVNAVNLNLGTLSPGSNGTVSTTTIIKVNQGRDYFFALVNTQQLQEEFSTFLVTISFSNSTQTTTITLGWPNAGYNDTVYLAPGTYTLYITLQYAVYNNAPAMSFSGNIVELGYN